ncbi:putative receptor-like protein kinase [Panicum miliaceum]|uniref:Receptor kinase-like protein Xa21 n=1 Tax=Panicum miliaceum TaxID=4540 RepID=A0A3L6QJ96_PANMI|nr:putative receptor-like protein kinase [Panicum miliaceum]
MPLLSVLHIANNSITGPIPPSLGNLSRLTRLALSNNYLQGTIPASIGNNGHLRLLLFSNNLSGLLPASLYNMSSLNYLSVANNSLHGSLPDDLGTSLPSIQQIQIAFNRFTGAVPPSIANLSSLEVFEVSKNKFHGVVPPVLAGLQHLRWFDIDGNEFEANDEKEWEFLTSLTNCSRLELLSIAWNRFTGKLPSSLANMSTSLQQLRMFGNGMSGAIPSGLGNLISLEMINIGQNLLSGVIPESIGALTRLNRLFLDSNNLSGLLPSSIGNLTSLTELDASINSLEGPIPSSIGNLGELLVLALANNKLTGAIPKEIKNLSSLSIYLDLSYNLLEGPLPSEIGALVHLENLAVSGNQLSGEIPDAISNCIVLQLVAMDDNSFQGSIPPILNRIQGLTQLNLTSNKLTGSIPGDLGSIGSLQGLYLAHNNLSGPIPKLLGNSTSLLLLDLSFNNLQGEVPTEGVFKNLTGLSITGNNELCGGIPQLHLPKCPNPTARKNEKAMSVHLRIAGITIGAILVLISGLALAVFLYRRYKAGTTKEQLPSHFTEIDLLMVSYNEILKGTDGFSEANLLGKGRYGTVYKGTIENQGVAVAVKVFNLKQSGSYKSFQAECEALRRVRHRCLVKIMTCCSSINHQGQDFRALVFEFMPNGSLESWIHSSTETQNGNRTLTLAQRLDIAADIVDALDYLHNGCQPSVVHCDLKPGNILLTQDMRARVGDFSIARVLNEAASGISVNSNSTIGIRGSIGYIAPEYGEGLGVSTYGDVYSLGIILIEMFTGKSPTDDMFRDGLSLHDFAVAALPEKVMEIADSRIWLHYETNSENATRNITEAKELLAAIIQIGVLCSKQSPGERLSMSNAAAEMHNIRDAFLSTQF